MFKHEKMLFHPVGVERPNPQYAVLLQEQLGGGNGELKAAMQCSMNAYDFKVKKRDGSAVSLCEYKGKVLLIVTKG